MTNEDESPIGGPCGWMWVRRKEKRLAQDDNPNHLPAGSPDGTGGQFAKKAAVSEETPEESNAYAVEKERRIQVFADRLEKSEELLEFAVSVLLVLPTKGKSLEGANILH